VHVSSIQIKNQTDYNLYLFEASVFGYDSARALSNSRYAQLGPPQQMKQNYRFLNDEFTARVKEYPVKYASFHLKGSLRFFLDPGRFDLPLLQPGERKETPGLLHFFQSHTVTESLKLLRSMHHPMVWFYLGMILFFNAMKCLGFILFLLNRKPDLALRLALFFLSGYLAFAAGPLGASRFMMPAGLLFTGAAVLGLLDGIHRFNKKIMAVSKERHNI